MYKTDLAAKLAATHKISEYKALKILNDICDTIQCEVAAGNSVVLTGFGTFNPSAQSARTIKGLDGKKHKIKARNSAHFVVGDPFKKRLNPPRKRGRPRKVKAA